MQGEGSDRRESVAEGGDKEVRVGHRGANTEAKPRGLGGHLLAPPET